MTVSVLPLFRREDVAKFKEFQRWRKVGKERLVNQQVIRLENPNKKLYGQKIRSSVQGKPCSKMQSQ